MFDHGCSHLLISIIHSCGCLYSINLFQFISFDEDCLECLVYYHLEMDSLFELVYVYQKIHIILFHHHSLFGSLYSIVYYNPIQSTPHQ